MDIAPAPTAIGALLLVASLACAPAQAANCPSEVRVSFPNFEFAPYVLGHDELESPPGLLVQWTRAALARAGCKPAITIKRRPANRQLVELQAGLLDILPGFSYYDGLPRELAFPMRDGAVDPDLVVMSNFISLYVRADDQSVKWDGKTLTSVNPNVGMSAGGPGLNRVAKSYAWDMEVAATPASDVRKLIAKRIDVILEPDLVLEPHLTGSDGKAVRKLMPPAFAADRYAPVRRRFQQQYPEFTRRFWLELCKESRASFPNLPACR